MDELIFGYKQNVIIRKNVIGNYENGNYENLRKNYLEKIKKGKDSFLRRLLSIDINNFVDNY